MRVMVCSMVMVAWPFFLVPMRMTVSSSCSFLSFRSLIVVPFVVFGFLVQ